jgi:hypothetical protein
MDATQFQAAFLAWASAATVCIAALVALAITAIKGVASVRAATVANATAVAGVSAKTDVHERQLNGDLTPRIEAVVDSRISQHRRPGDNAAPVGPTAAPPA